MIDFPSLFEQHQYLIFGYKNHTYPAISFAIFPSQQKTIHSYPVFHLEISTWLVFFQCNAIACLIVTSLEITQKFLFLPVQGVGGVDFFWGFADDCLFIVSSRGPSSGFEHPWCLPCWPKQIVSQIFPQQRLVYLGSAENCDLRSTTMGSPVKDPAQERKEDAFVGKKRKLRYGQVWGYGRQKVHGLSLTESLSEKEPGLPFFSWDLHCHWV